MAIRVALKLRKAGIFGKAMVRILEVLRRMGFESPAAVAIDIRPGREVVVTPRDGESFSVIGDSGQLLLDLKWDCRGEALELERLLKKEPESIRRRKTAGRIA